MKRKYKIQSRNGFTLVELMMSVAMVAILAATALGAFEGYVARSKASEAPRALSKMAAGQMSYFARTASFTEAGPTNIPPANVKRQVDFSLDPRWTLIDFSFSDPIYFGYQAVANGDSIDCEAIGDLNGNGDTSIYRVTVNAPSAPGNPPTVTGLIVFDELE